MTHLFKNMLITATLLISSTALCMDKDTKQTKEIAPLSSATGAHASAPAQPQADTLNLNSAVKVDVERMNAELIESIAKKNTKSLSSILNLLTALEAAGIPVKKQVVNKTSSLRYSPFFVAIFYGQFETVKLLIQHGADMHELAQANNFFKQPIGSSAHSFAISRWLECALAGDQSSSETYKQIADFLEPLMAPKSAAAE